MHVLAIKVSLKFVAIIKNGSVCVGFFVQSCNDDNNILDL